MSDYVDKFIRITWEDAWSDTDYWTKQQLIDEGPCIIETHGLCIRETETGITICTEMFVDPKAARTRYRKVQHIPKPCIKKVDVFICP